MVLFWCFAWTGSDTNEPTERAEKTRQVSANDEEFLLFCYVLCGLCLRVLSTILMKFGGFIFNPMRPRSAVFKLKAGS